MSDGSVLRRKLQAQSKAHGAAPLRYSAPYARSPRLHEFWGKKVFGVADDTGCVDGLASVFAWPCSDASCSWLAG